MLPTLSAASLLVLHIVHTSNPDTKVADVRQIFKLFSSSYYEKYSYIFTEKDGWIEFSHSTKKLSGDGKTLTDDLGNVIDSKGNINGSKILRIGTGCLSSIVEVDYPERYYNMRNGGLRIIRKRSLSFNLVALADKVQILNTISELDGKNVRYLDKDKNPTVFNSPAVAIISADIIGKVTGEVTTVYYVILPKRKVDPFRFFRYGIYEEAVLTF